MEASREREGVADAVARRGETQGCDAAEWRWGEWIVSVMMCCQDTGVAVTQ